MEAEAFLKTFGLTRPWAPSWRNLQECRRAFFSSIVAAPPKSTF